MNRISNSVSNVKELLDNAEYEKDSIDNYISAAWVCRVGIMDNIEKLKLPMTTKISVNIGTVVKRIKLYNKLIANVI